MLKVRIVLLLAVSGFAVLWGAGTVQVCKADETDIAVYEYIDIPDDKMEIITAEPAGDFIWIPGSWEREASNWNWVKGAWKKPPHKNARWVDGHWKYKEAKWHWTRGYWLVASDGYIVDEFCTIPAALPELRPERRSKNHHRVAGYWEWDATWFRMPGFWTLKPNPKAEWVAGHWDPFGVQGWRWMAGHWNVR